MKVLWLSTSKSLYNPFKSSDSYNGAGWVDALEREINKFSEIELAIAFPTNEDNKKLKRDKTVYYPIKNRENGLFNKLLRYYGLKKIVNSNQYVSEIKAIIDEYQPDIIHLFGIECFLATIIGHTNVPIVVHLQGILGPINNTFFPVGLSKRDVIKYGSFFREIIVRNGYSYSKRNIAERAAFEKDLLRKVNYAMGRTHWDKLILDVYSKNYKYYKVNEILRPHFYESKRWNIVASNNLCIVSTISETMYKGFDLILKTAEILCDECKIQFSWNVIGVNDKSTFVNIFEKIFNIKSSRVNVKLLGILNAKEICEQFLNSSMYVHPAYIDNSPNSICEAQYLGLPVISTNVGGISSLIENEFNGLLVPSNSPIELAYKILFVANNEDYALNLSNNARETAVKRHDKSVISAELIKTYQSVISSKAD